MKASRVLIILGLLVSSLFLVPAVAAVAFPQLALGGGYEVILLVSNNGTATWEGKASLRQGNEQPWAGNWAVNGVASGGSDFDILLTGGSTKKFVLTGDASLRAGYLRIDPENGLSSQPITTSFFYNFLTPGQAAAQGGPSPSSVLGIADLLDSTGVPAQAPSAKFVFAVEKTANLNTGFAWAPFSIGTAFGITATLFREDGTQFQQKARNFAGHLAEFFSETFDNVPDGFVGRMEIESQELIFLTVLRLEFTDSGFQLTSVPPKPLLEFHTPVFVAGETIPDRHGCVDENFVSPPLTWVGSPEGVQSWALIVQDPDAPVGTFSHWVIFNLPAHTRQLEEGIPRDQDTLANGARQGTNDFSLLGYGPPCPPPGPDHRYFFRLFGLDSRLTLAPGATKAQLEDAMTDHIVCSTQLMGWYGR